MKAKFFFLMLLISLLGMSQVKADTIVITMSSSVQFDAYEGCGIGYDIGEFDTYIIKKPSNYPESVYWWVSSSHGHMVPYPLENSVVYTPVFEDFDPISRYARIDIVFEYLGYERVLLLYLYDNMPDAPTFGASGEYYFSSPQDTLWSCNSSVSIYVNGTNNTTYELWQDPTGAGIGSSDVLNTSLPGMYKYISRNGCGWRRDSLILSFPPTTLPVIEDPVFCNTPVGAILDAGPGWNTYLWNTGETTPDIFVEQAGEYTVNLTNVCLTGTVFVEVFHEDFPWVETYGEGFFCQYETTVLYANPGYEYDTYTWYWINGDQTYFTPTLTIDSSKAGWYDLIVTKGACSAIGAATVRFHLNPMQPYLCVVTVDSSLNKNLLVWGVEWWEQIHNHVYAKTVQYNIYKWAGGTNWNLLGTLPVEDIHIFVDQTSNPPVTSATYKIELQDVCGAVSPMSYYHRTVLLLASSGNNPGEVNLSWTPYVDESGSFVPDQYEIWRGDSPSTLQYYASTPYTSYVDVGVVGQKYYQIFISSESCDPSPMSYDKGSKSMLFSGSRSNLTNHSTSSVEKNLYHSLSLYPNPSSGIFTVKGDNISSIEVKDIRGNIILTTIESTIDLSDCAAGVYIVTAHTNQGSTNLRLIKQ